MPHLSFNLNLISKFWCLFSHINIESHSSSQRFAHKTCPEAKVHVSWSIVCFTNCSYHADVGGMKWTCTCAGNGDVVHSGRSFSANVITRCPSCGVADWLWLDRLGPASHCTRKLLLQSTKIRPSRRAMRALIFQVWHCNLNFCLLLNGALRHRNSSLKNSRSIGQSSDVSSGSTPSFTQSVQKKSSAILRFSGYSFFLLEVHARAPVSSPSALSEWTRRTHFSGWLSINQHGTPCPLHEDCSGVWELLCGKLHIFPSSWRSMETSQRSRHVVVCSLDTVKAPVSTRPPDESASLHEKSRHQLRGEKDQTFPRSDKMCQNSLSLFVSLSLLSFGRGATSTLNVSCALGQESPAPSYSSTEDIANFDSVLTLCFSNPEDRVSPTDVSSTVTSTLSMSCALDQEGPSCSSKEDTANLNSVLTLHFSNPEDRASFPRFDDCCNVVTERVIYSESFTQWREKATVIQFRKCFS